MPCTYFESERELAERKEQQIQEAVDKRTAELKAELDAATNAACVLSQVVEEAKLTVKDKKVTKWVKDHKKMDEKRNAAKGKSK